MKKQLLIKSIALVIALFALTPMSKAQELDYIEIAPNNLASIGINCKTYSQEIYTAEEMGNETNLLYALILNRINSSTSPTNTVVRNMRIYLGHRSTSTFSNENDWTPMSDLTKVFGGEVTFVPGMQWDTIVFDQPFFYSPIEGNLVLVIEDNSPELLQNVLHIQSHVVSDHSNVLAYKESGVTDMFPWTITNSSATLGYFRHNVRFMVVEPPARPYSEHNTTISESFSTNYRDVEVDWRLINEQGCYWNVANSCATVVNTTGEEHANSIESPFLMLGNDNNYGRVSFRAKGAGSGSSISVELRCTPYSDWRVAKTITGIGSSWSDYSVDLTSGEKMQVRIVVTGTNSVSIDDISIESLMRNANSSTTEWYTFMRFVNDDGSSYYDYGIAKFDLNTMSITSRLTESTPYSDDVMAAEYADGYVYFITTSRSESYLYRIPMSNPDADPENIAELERYVDYVDMAYDSINHIMYTLHRYDGIYTIDLATGEEELFMYLDDDEEGSLSCFALQSPTVMYGMSDCENARLIRLDLNTLSMSVVAETGCAIHEDISQGLAFDQNSGELIWIHNGSAYKEYGIYSIDVNTGVFSYLGKLNGGAQTSSLFMLPVEQPVEVLSTRTWYGNLYYNTSSLSLMESQFVDFTMQNLSDFGSSTDNLTPNDPQYISAVLASAYVNDTIYYVTMSTTLDEETAFFSLYKTPFNGGHPSTGTLIRQYDDVFFTGLAFNQVDGKLYAMTIMDSPTNPYTSFCEVDRTTGHLMAQPTNQPFSCLAIDKYGVNYTYSYEGGVVVFSNNGITNYYPLGGNNLDPLCLFIDPNTDEIFFTVSNDYIYKLVIDDNGSSHAAQIGNIAYGRDMGVLTGVFTTPQSQAVDIVAENVGVCVYPNPSSDIVNVSADGNISMIQIYSINGSLQRIEGRQFGNSASIDINGLAAGTYLIRIATDKGTATKRLMVK